MENLTTFPELTTPRLQLRQIVADDIREVHRGLSDPRVTVYYAVAFPTLEATREQMDWYEQIWKERSGIWWAITLKEEEKMIGAIGFNNYQAAHHKAEAGYWLLPEYWRKGYASEAMEAVLKVAFTKLKLHRIEAFVEAGNEVSNRILEKFGFVQEGCLRECEIKDNRYIDLYIYALLKRDRKH